MCYKDLGLGFLQLQFDKNSKVSGTADSSAQAEPFLRKFTVDMSVKGAAPNIGSVLHICSLVVPWSRKQKSRIIACAQRAQEHKYKDVCTSYYHLMLLLLDIM